MEIVSIILRLKNQEIKVTIDEAKELFGQLAAVFGGEKPIIQKEFVPVPYGIPYPVYPQPQPHWWEYPWYTKPWWDNQPILVFDNGDTGNITWRDHTCIITSGTTGNLIDSLTYSVSGQASSDWLDKSGVSFSGAAVGRSTDRGVQLGTGVVFHDVKSNWNLGGSPGLNSGTISIQ